jgi:mono/diheme cytochrome c family protein
MADSDQLPVIYDPAHISRLYVAVTLYSINHQLYLCMKQFIIASAIALAVWACSGNNSSGNADNSNTTSSEASGATAGYDTARGTGRFTNIELSPTLDKAKAEAGQKVYDVKCAACHKLTSEKLVGPGWAGVTKRHRPEWILNFTTNVDEMLQKDPKAQAMLEICLVRMPNQNLTDDDAFAVLEFMRQNDGVK